MKIVSYNINGLRSRVSQHGSLQNLLDGLNADVICFQETKLSRRELTTDLATPRGYEAFFSCTRTSVKGRIGYSGVVTFCRVKSAFDTTDVSLPLTAEEGFTGLLADSTEENYITNSLLRNLTDSEGFELTTEKDLLKVDSEGRCVITDHGHFVLFNIYGPRAEADNPERIHFKTMFFMALQKRWEIMLSSKKRLIVVGDFNIAPSAIDHCDPGPNFKINQFRRWLSSLLVVEDGAFSDAFRELHPDRENAYTCWSQQTGAEEFNFGTRIDLILVAGPCLHREGKCRSHKFMECHVQDCDILSQYKRQKPDNIPRWKGGRSFKLDGSDHAPVYVKLHDIPELIPHSTPPTSTRYLPEIRGWQQTIISMFGKGATGKGTSGSDSVQSFHEISIMETGDDVKRSAELENPESDIQETSLLSLEKNSQETPSNTSKSFAKKAKLSQLKLQVFFEKTESVASSSQIVSDTCSISSQDEAGISEHWPNFVAKGHTIFQDSRTEREVNDLQEAEDPASTSGLVDAIDGHASQTFEMDQAPAASLEWQRIQCRMRESIPVCKGHKEPCVARAVKKNGPNQGRGFYVCARAKGPSSNPEARCDHFQWATSTSKRRR